MELGIEGRTAVVCGASRGLGWACAQALVAEGVTVTLVGRDREALNGAREGLTSLTRAGAQVHVRATDLSRPENCEDLIAHTGVPDILVSNVGGPPIASDPSAIGRALWEAAMASLFHGPVALISACVPRMRERRFGRIVNISSAAVLRPPSGFALSVAPRSALISYCNLLAREVASDNVTLNHLLPHSIETQRLMDNLTIQAAQRGIDVDAMRAQRAQTTPARRLGRPEELGTYCAFLCSAQASYITGRQHVLDGGAYI